MKAKYLIAVMAMIALVLVSPDLMAQCSLCTRTAEQVGPQAAKGLNGGILYLMAMPFGIVGFIGYRWWKSNQGQEEDRA